MKTIAYIIAAAIAATTASHGITTSFGTSELILADRTAEGYGWVEIAQSRVITDFELDLIQLIAQHPEQIRTELYLSAVGSILAQAGAETKPQTRLQILDSDTGIWFSDPRAMGLGHSGRKNGVEWEATPAEILQEMLSEDAKTTVNTILGIRNLIYFNYIPLAVQQKTQQDPDAYIGALQYADHRLHAIPSDVDTVPTNWTSSRPNSWHSGRLVNRDGHTPPHLALSQFRRRLLGTRRSGLDLHSIRTRGRLMIYPANR